MSKQGKSKRLAVVISFSGDGGVERMVTNLCNAAAEHVQIDVLALKLKGGHAGRLSQNIRVIPLKAQHSWSGVPELARYLEDHRPDALLAAKDRAGRAALKAARRARTGTPVFIRLGTNLSAALERKDALSRWLRVAPMRRLYPLASGVVAVSEGVRQDTLSVTEMDPKRITVIRNPVITPQLAEQAGASAPHPWLETEAPPTIIGMGRLTRQKDFPTLMRAFAELRQRQSARLIILGTAPRPEDLKAHQALAEELGIAADLLLPGFQANPYAWLSRAKLFVLSSAWEGSPNALTEALALGIPSVSTDCPSGPAETLAGGKYGPLVPVGDAHALANAMAETLRQPLPAATLVEAVREYRADLCAKRYLDYLGLLPSSSS